ncbi:MAG: hypothetical protein IKR68_08100 [Lachnospiraceae bacterium]|nr:hypothetical protein [Lachnospiraceae bacterium]
MNGKFFDDEEEIEVRPRKRVVRKSPAELDAGDTGDIRPRRERPAGRQNPQQMRAEGSSRQINRRRPNIEVREMRDPEGLSLETDIIRYVMLALLVIAVTVFTVKFLEASLLMVLVIQVILVVMGILLKNTPVFVSLLIALLILVAGMITKNTDIVLCGNATFLATILTFKS